MPHDPNEASSSRAGGCHLSSLIARLEKAEGQSRELDARICWALGLEPWAGTEEILLPHFSAGSRIDRETPAFTSSIDAAVSLAERVLPGWQINLSIFHDSLSEASFGNRETQSTTSFAKKPAMTLVLATLRALDQKGGTE